MQSWFLVLGSAMSRVLWSRGGKGEWEFEAEEEQQVCAQVAGKGRGQPCVGSWWSVSSRPAGRRDVRLSLRVRIWQKMLARLSAALSVNMWPVHLRRELCSCQTPETLQPILRGYLLCDLSS